VLRTTVEGYWWFSEIEWFRVPLETSLKLEGITEKRGSQKKRFAPFREWQIADAVVPQQQS
jgi:hypothetical protein